MLLDAGAWRLERAGAQRRSSRCRFFSVGGGAGRAGGSGPVTLGLRPVGWTTAWAFWTLITVSPSLVPRLNSLLGFYFEFEFLMVGPCQRVIESMSALVHQIKLRTCLVFGLLGFVANCRRKLVGSLPWGIPTVVVYR